MSDLSKFIEFADAVIKRPAMNGANRVEDIQLILFGYSFGAKDNDASEFLDGFRVHVNKHFKTRKDHGWDRLIRFYSGSDSHSIELFSKLFQEYKKKSNLI